jgi:protein SCO1/2
MRKKESYIKAYGRPEAASGWHFLTGEESQIKKLADQVGFGYRYDEKEKQYAHSAAMYVLTPEGKISRYLYGVEYPNKDLRLALLEASNGKIGTVVDRFLLFCYRYDPNTRSYSIYLTKLMQTACGATMLIFGSYLFVFWRRQRKGAYSNV